MESQTSCLSGNKKIHGKIINFGANFTKEEQINSIKFYQESRFNEQFNESLKAKGFTWENGFILITEKNPDGEKSASMKRIGIQFLEGKKYIFISKRILIVEKRNEPVN